MGRQQGCDAIRCRELNAVGWKELNRCPASTSQDPEVALIEGQQIVHLEAFREDDQRGV